MSGIADNTMQALHYAMGGLTARAEARATNISNAETPGFQAKTVDFETTLAAALKSGRRTDVSAPTVSNKDNIPDALGNTVDLEKEMVEMLADDVLYEAMISGFNAKIKNLRTAIGGR